MSGRAKKLTVLVAGLAAAALLWGLSGSTWGRSGRYPVVRKSLQTAGLPGAEGGTYRLILNAPPTETRLGDIMVSEEIFHAVTEGDTIEFSVRKLPAMGIEAFDFRAARSGATAAEWKEGHPFLFVGIGIGGLAAGLLVTGAAALVASLLRLGGPPEA